eukprot:CAMPEP_0194398270 /NCGR_PEP_ID=MMETSP0174-20130528/126009_1 /TAXON_ID=216777 /ORGANISM="Proboscia alata, Strain PI-D3" /LENGTH=421 /DNA_ID=CAMNT_0039194545 /DNA_START=170 /DNA_END=1432 /DNA_ORIENTATION=+
MASGASKTNEKESMLYSCVYGAPVVAAPPASVLPYSETHGSIPPEHLQERTNKVNNNNTHHMTYPVAPYSATYSPTQQEQLQHKYTKLSNNKNHRILLVNPIVQKKNPSFPHQQLLKSTIMKTHASPVTMQSSASSTIAEKIPCSSPRKERISSVKQQLTKEKNSERFWDLRRKCWVVVRRKEVRSSSSPSRSDRRKRKEQARHSLIHNSLIPSETKRSDNHATAATSSTCDSLRGNHEMRTNSNVCLQQPPRSDKYSETNKLSRTEEGKKCRSSSSLSSSSRETEEIREIQQPLHFLTDKNLNSSTKRNPSHASYTALSSLDSSNSHNHETINPISLLAAAPVIRPLPPSDNMRNVNNNSTHVLSDAIDSADPLCFSLDDKNGNKNHVPAVSVTCPSIPPTLMQRRSSFFGFDMDPIPMT